MKRLSTLPTRQAGVGLVTAIFLLVVLAGLGVAMVSLFTSQQASAGLDLQGARAYQAARAGIEWGLYQRLRKDAPCKGDSSTLDMPADSSLAGFTVIVTCTQPDSGVARYTIVSLACNIRDDKGGCDAVNKAESVRRQLEVQL
jgi:MSHA biogenesis protein MshP